jgi:hypothetical protein
MKTLTHFAERIDGRDLLLLFGLIALITAILFFPNVFKSWSARAARRKQIADALEFVRLVEHLREGDSDSVTILCQAEEGQTDAGDTHGVDVNGEWTRYDDRRFYGRTILHALRAASNAKIEASHIGRTVKL